MSKRAKTDEEGQGSTQALCEEMQKVQDQIEEIEEEFDAKVLELQSQFNTRKKPLFMDRNKIIDKLPNFWFQAFQRHKALELMLQQDDGQIFKFISSVVVDEKEDIKSGFKITMEFKENPFFTNSVLWKELTFTENSETEITQSGVDWKPGKNPSAAKDDAKVGAKREWGDMSFFSFFEDARKDNIFAANIIKDDLWPNPLKYYLGELDEDEDEEDDIGDSVDEEDEFGDEEEEEGEQGEKEA